MPRLVFTALVLALAACTTASPGARDDAFSASGKTPGATAAASARSGASHALVTPGALAGAIAKTR